MPQELRFALRSLLRSPGFLIMAVGSLAIAIGASVAAFSVIDASASAACHSWMRIASS